MFKFKSNSFTNQQGKHNSIFIPLDLLIQYIIYPFTIRRKHLNNMGDLSVTSYAILSYNLTKGGVHQMQQNPMIDPIRN